MAYTIKLIEITNPFAEDFGLVITDVVLQKPMSVEEFIATQYLDEVRYAYLNMEEVDLSTMIVAGNSVLVADEPGKSALSIVASIAVMSVAWWAAPHLAVGMGMMASTTSAWTFGTMASFSVLNAVGSILINALITPDKIDTSSSSLDKSKAYLWSGVRNQSEQMIPIPIVLGTFQIAGNLINTYTETHKVSSSGISIRDTIYLMYGLTANELQSISTCKINDMDADTFDETDRSVYYTKGTSDQEPFDTRISTALYAGETAAPASVGLLFPNLIEETTVNQLIEIPYHNFIKTTSNVSIFTDGTDLGISVNLAQSLAAGVIGTINLKKADDVTIPVSGVIRITHSYSDLDNNESVAEYNTGINNIDEDTTTATINITTRDEKNHAFISGDIVQFYTAATKNIEIVTNLTYNASEPWDIWTQERRSTYITQACTSTSIDDIKIQLVFDRGLYSMSNKSGDKYERVMGFDFSVLKGGVTEKLTLPIAHYDDLTTTEQKYCVRGKYTSTHFIEFKLVDILTDAEIINSFTSVFLNTSKTALIHGAYTVGVRIAFTQTHGRYAVNQNMLSWANHAYDPTAENSRGTDFYDCHFSRIEGLNYNTVLNYPSISLLGLVLNATPVINNQLPKITVVASGKFYYYVSGADIKAEVSTWTEGSCENPAYLAINIMYDDLWGGKIGGLKSLPTKDADFADIVDIDSFVELADYCDDIVTIDNTGNTGVRYTYNGLIDTEMSLWEALQLVLKAANAAPIFDGKKITVYWDKADTTIVQLFTTSNIKEGSFIESFLGEDNLAECISGNFIDAGDNYNKNSIIYMPAGADPNKRTDIELYGIVDTARALRALQQKLKKTTTLRQIFNFDSADASALSCEVGDKIGIQYEFIDFESNDNSIAGRIKVVNGTIITLDKKVTEIVITPTLILRINDSTIHTRSIINWDNTGITTVLTISSVITGSVALDIYLLGSTANFYKEAIISGLDINDDLSASVIAINYDAAIYNSFYGVVVNTVTNPNIIKADVIVNNLKATYVPGTVIVVTWDVPLFGDADYYMVYKKTNDSVAQYLGRSDTTTYYDPNFALNEMIYYKVLPVIIYRGTPITIPLSWASYSIVVDLTSGLLEYMEAPDYSLVATLTAGKIGCADLTITIDDPGGWVFKDRREGFIIWTRFNASNITDDWFGPINITLSTVASFYGATIQVNSIIGLPTLGGVVCCLLLIDNCDLVAIYGNTGTTLNVIQHGIANANRKYALSKIHNSGVPVYIANKGFFPVKYFGFEEDCTAYGSNNQISVASNKIYSYDAVTNTMTVGNFNTDFMNSKKVASVYVDGNSNSMAGIKSFTQNALILDRPMPAADFAVHLVGQDILGNYFGAYEMYWQDDSLYKTFKFDADSGNLYGTIQAIPIAAQYAWVAVNRILWATDPTKDKFPTGWVSNPKIYL